MSKPIYVVQEHNALKAGLHYDLRLEIINTEGERVLRSWAIPKGIPETLGVRRLCISTPDHAMTWAKFEGTIPAGEYGAGKVSIKDSGWYLPITLSKGKMKFEIHGKRLNGVWKLTEMSGPGDKWLLERVEVPSGKRKV